MTFVFPKVHAEADRLAGGVNGSQHLLELLRCVCRHDDVIGKVEVGQTLLPADLAEDCVRETDCEQSR